MNKTQEKTVNDIIVTAGKKIGSIIHIEGTGEDFDVNTRAERKCKELGFTVGTMQRDEVRGLADANRIRVIEKWRNISSKDYCRLDGVLVSDDFRNGRDAYIVLFEDK